MNWNAKIVLAKISCSSTSIHHCKCIAIENRQVTGGELAAAVLGLMEMRLPLCMPRSTAGFWCRFAGLGRNSLGEWAYTHWRRTTPRMTRRQMTSMQSWRRCSHNAGAVVMLLQMWRRCRRDAEANMTLLQAWHQWSGWHQLTLSGTCWWMHSLFRFFSQISHLGIGSWSSLPWAKLQISLGYLQIPCSYFSQIDVLRSRYCSRAGQCCSSQGSACYRDKCAAQSADRSLATNHPAKFPGVELKGGWSHSVVHMQFRLFKTIELKVWAWFL